jgi:hypothetical protein
MGVTPELIVRILAVFCSLFLIAAFGGTAVCAVIGALIGNGLLHKYFVEAGIL